ncbi:cupin domain-containing protein [Pseudomonas sp. ZM23]|uniref:Cupin domain-containing protein n=1 Tax=Pseudomonas triclosanedens TaxID=2961893 RepID=A0ABY7A4J4_9PSED|nr:cupin domain-containing protein [Pseudomonas triclosanedens]MCP8466456.1 cupin domain-containing protein [Pseudomonas triclosanedens]MCP8473142.1 cupin domain-containing protein [Pseudomonas triclosanedens]MCP8479019.1 cupin domain-containing protein [Pseudomonas triclosanedens]WAI52131.1 cupin domain-containing protein [Pseudomonas triclosanedens]
MFPSVSAKVLFTSLALSLPAFAHGDSAPAEKIDVRQEQNLPDAPGKKGLMITVSYAPGQASGAHVHSGSVFAYVLDGAVISQLEGQKPVTYHAGQSWYEAPNTPHLVSRNASNSQPARLLVWMLLDEQAPVLAPLKR